jgi:hypothetical protein
MKPQKGWLMALLFLIFSGEGMSGPLLAQSLSPGAGPPAKSAEGVATVSPIGSGPDVARSHLETGPLSKGVYRFHLDTAWRFHLNHRLFSPDRGEGEPVFPGLKESDAEHFLKMRRLRFENRDEHGKLLLSISGRRLKVVIQGISGEEVWIAQWTLD